MSYTYLWFTGDQVAYYTNIDSSGNDTIFQGSRSPFEPGDLIRIKIDTSLIDSNDEFKDRDGYIHEIVVVRDGEKTTLTTKKLKIHAPGGKEQGDDFFVTTDQIKLDKDSPFYSSSHNDKKFVFSTTASFSNTESENVPIPRKEDHDYNGDGKISGGNEKGNGRFNVTGVYDEGKEVPCYGPDTLIRTARGEVRAQDLVVGDLVMTRDAGPQPIRWIGRRLLDAKALIMNPNLRPIRIRAGALGDGLPVADLVVSPQHRVLVRSAIAQRMFGAREVLVAAKQLLEIDGIEIATDLPEIEYTHFLCDDHQIVIANGAESESLYTGPQALRSVGKAAQEEIFTIFPELRDRALDERPESVRKLLSGREGRKLAARHAQNTRNLVEAAYA